ncbi:MAG TPA: hypothetical protein PL110_15970 [Candidatus Eremiobacteraeota bacterium]|nr:hypothetical protein [Candidatus Eremiobacteraeota bacterium]
MSVINIDRDYLGNWHIYQMDIIDVETDVKAVIRINQNRLGHFEIGMVSGEIDGKVTYYPDGKRFEFSWIGINEKDRASGWGWLKKKDKDSVEGYVKIHLGDELKFLARRV